MCLYYFWWGWYEKERKREREEKKERKKALKRERGKACTDATLTSHLLWTFGAFAALMGVVANRPFAIKECFSDSNGELGAPFESLTSQQSYQCDWHLACAGDPARSAIYPESIVERIQNHLDASFLLTIEVFLAHCPSFYFTVGEPQVKKTKSNLQQAKDQTESESKKRPKT